MLELGLERTSRVVKEVPKTLAHVWGEGGVRVRIRVQLKVRVRVGVRV